MTAEQIVQIQLDAYNNRQIDDFIATYTADVEIYNFQESEPFLKGHDALRAVYGDVFDNSPNLNATIDQRIVLGNKVVDHEKVTGRKGIDFIEVIVIYEVTNGLISKVTFIRS